MKCLTDTGDVCPAYVQLELRVKLLEEKLQLVSDTLSKTLQLLAGVKSE